MDVYLIVLLMARSRCSSLELPPCFFHVFDVALEMIRVFAGWSCRPCAVVAAVKSSSMAVVCLSETLMRRMSSAT